MFKLPNWRAYMHANLFTWHGLMIINNYIILWIQNHRRFGPLFFCLIYHCNQLVITMKLVIFAAFWAQVLHIHIFTSVYEDKGGSIDWPSDWDGTAGSQTSKPARIETQICLWVNYTIYLCYTVHRYQRLSLSMVIVDLVYVFYMPV